MLKKRNYIALLVTTAFLFIVFKMNKKENGRHTELGHESVNLDKKTLEKIVKEKFPKYSNVKFSDIGPIVKAKTGLKLVNLERLEGGGVTASFMSEVGKTKRQYSLKKSKKKPNLFKRNYHRVLNKGKKISLNGQDKERILDFLRRFSAKN